MELCNYRRLDRAELSNPIARGRQICVTMNCGNIFEIHLSPSSVYIYNTIILLVKNSSNKWYGCRESEIEIKYIRYHRKKLNEFVFTKDKSE